MFALPTIRLSAGRAILSRARRIVFVAALASSASIPAMAASPAPAEPTRPAADPSALAAELNAELQLVYRDNVPEYAQRSEQVRRALDTWNASSKSAAERNQIIAWIHESIRLSMPGSTKPLPPLPAPIRDPIAPAHDTAPAASASKSVLTAKPVAVPVAAESHTAPEPQASPEPPTANPTPPRGGSEDNPFRDDPKFPQSTDGLR
jgi:hypothetical protein